MIRMPKRLRTALIILALVLAYVVAFPRPTGTEPLLQRQWISSIDESPAETSLKSGSGHDAARGKIMPFQLGERFGYFSSEGEIVFSDRIRYGLAQSEEYFANYSVVSENIVLQDPGGSLVRSIATTGYPYLLNDRFFVFGPNGSSVSEWTTDGEKLWQREFFSVLTDFDGGNAYSAAALLDGEVQLLDKDGSTTFSHRVDGSRIDVALSVAVAADEDAFAALLGADPQQLLLFERHSEGFFPAFQQELKSDYRRSVLLEFLPDMGILVVEQPYGMLMYDRDESAVSPVDFGGPVRQVDTIPELDLVLSLSAGTPAPAERSSENRNAASGPDVRRLSATFRPNETLISKALPGGDAFVRTEGSRIYFGMKGMLACIELVKG